MRYSRTLALLAVSVLMGAGSTVAAGQDIVLQKMQTAAPAAGGTIAVQSGGRIVLQDFRGGPAGWSLTGKVTDFTGPGAKIDAGALSWSPSCATKAGSPSTCQAGSAGAVGSSGATLASTPNAALTGGEFTVDAGLSLNVPAFTPVGTYSGVLTLTLS